MKPIYVLFSCFVLLATIACSSNEAELEKKLQQLDAQTRSQLKLLQSHIDNKRVKNAEILAHYAKITKIRSPEYSEIADSLSLDSTNKGPIFESLKARLTSAQEQLTGITSQGIEPAQSLLDEYQNILFASSLDNYNLALTDPVNVLADLSENKLPRIDAQPKAQSLADNGAKDLGAGSQLVGNPHYGQWQQNSSGTSFWAFYGQYALLSRLFDRPYSYGDWSRNRDYSYYHDVGRRQYSSPKQQKQQAQVETRVKKNFTSKGQSFKSPYDKTRSSGTTKKNIVSTPSKFKSSSSKFASKYGNTSSSKKAASTKTKSSFFSRSGSKSRTFRGGGK